MPEIKKHYKIFIAILIVIILISSFIVYDITRNNTTYNNNGEPVDVKYFGGSFPPMLFANTGNHTASSYYVNHNKLSYMNSTITEPRVLPCSYGSLFFGINIHLKNINNKYIYVDIASPAQPSVFDLSLNNATEIHFSYTHSICHVKYKINGNNISISGITIRHINNFVHNYYYNISVRVSLSNNLYNTFYISTIKETTIYGKILNTHGQLYNVNTTLLIENTNNSNYRIMHP